MNLDTYRNRPRNGFPSLDAKSLIGSKDESLNLAA